MKTFSSIQPPHIFHFSPFFSSTSIRTRVPFSARIFFCQAKSGTNESFNIKALPPILLAEGNLHPHIVYLMELGMDIDQIRTIMRRSPAFARYSLEGKIKPLVEFFLELGVPKEQIPIILTKRPQLCGISLSGSIKPTMKFLESLSADKKHWAKAIYRFPTLLTYSRNKINENVDFLCELGISDESIGRILTRFPNIISCSVEDNLRPTATYFRSLGVNVGTLLLRCPQIIGLSIEANIKPVTEFFLERGYTLEEIGTMISRCAMLYTYSLTGTMIPKLDFFMTTDYPKSELVKFPQYFGYSLEQRIKPRYARMKAYGVRLVLNRLLSASSSNFEAIDSIYGLLLDWFIYDHRYLNHHNEDVEFQCPSRFLDETTSIQASDFPQTLQLSKPIKMKTFSSIQPPHYFHSTSIRFSIRTQVPFSARIFFCHAKSGTNESLNIQVLPPKLLANPRIVYLMELGMNNDQIWTIMRRFPAFTRYSFEGKIKPLVEFFLEFGVPKEQILIILVKRPSLCGLSLSKNIKPTVKFLESLGTDKKQWAKAIYRFPSLLAHSRQKIKETVDFLHEAGISDETVGRILTRFPNIIGLSVEDNLRPTATYFRTLGANVGTLLFRCPEILALSIEANIKPVTQFFLEKGYTLEEIGTMITRYGMLYTISLTKNVMPKWDYFMTMDYPKSELVKFPHYFGYSLEQRIKPRYAHMKSSGRRLTLNWLLSMSSSDFEKVLKLKNKEIAS
ncbi:hypothetical protein TSUD_405140 [Trifolium subterraneum]|uniref:Uncharacterized protein n=1 Tax=Trifolium subterraneum TaxID=3900 RepID=A0A2Z6NVQ3_TRISU|nr:hypothetical protein TSUD_405140 [Trifolium subterraneum]